MVDPLRPEPAEAAAPGLELRLEVASIVASTTAEGPGRRFALWVQGCTLRCPRCCNPQMFARGRRPELAVSALLERLDRAVEEHAVEGITVLGGEPLEQLPALTALCRGAHARGLGVLVFSGHRLDEAQRRPGFAALWPYVDTMVDGRYEADLPEPAPSAGGRRFIGSSNQGLRHRSDRYRDPALWRGAAGIEVRIDERGGFDVHGEPGTVERLLRALRA